MATKRALQRSIVETCGISNFGVLHSKVADIIQDVQNFNTEEDTGDDGQDTWDNILRFGEIIQDAQKSACPVPEYPFPDFFDQVYPAYLCAMTSVSHYFLSDVELISLAHCTRTNVAIFKEDPELGKFRLLRFHIEHDDTDVILTCIQAGRGTGEVRTHFERFEMKESLVEDAEEQTNPQQLQKEREKKGETLSEAQAKAN